MKNNISKKTVTIGIPAHNEEANIAKLLDSILMQKSNSYDLSVVIIACDDCHDNTAAIVKSYMKKYTWITLIDDKNRVGQALRLNRLYALCTSDIFITFDADTVLAGPYVIEEIVKAFKNKNIGLVGGLDLPVIPRTFSEKIIVSGILLWHNIRINYNKGDNVHNHQGRISALSRDMYTDIRIPNDIIANDEYLYFAVRKLGKRFKFAPKAIVYYRESTNLKDFFKQSSRFLDNRQRIEKHFGMWVKKFYSIPFSIKMHSIAQRLVSDPIYTLLGIISQIALRILKPFYKENYIGGVWTTITSTKDYHKK